MDSDLTQSGIKSPLFTNQVEIGRMLEDCTNSSVCENSKQTVINVKFLK